MTVRTARYREDGDDELIAEDKPHSIIHYNDGGSWWLHPDDYVACKAAFKNGEAFFDGRGVYGQRALLRGDG